MSAPRHAVRAALVALGAALAGAAGAQGLSLGQSGGSAQPIEIVARDGIEWNREARRYIARGDARATQGDTTVAADMLTASYRERRTGGGTDIYRYQADGRVRISTPTHIAVGDRAVYDVDSGVLVLTGDALKLTTASETLTARDAMEYWERRRVAVARGDALVVTEDGRRLKADILTAYFADKDAPAPGRPGRPARAAAAAGTSGAGAGGAQERSKLERIEAFGGVHISTPTEIAVGDRGVYNAETGIAVLAGNVRITRGDNQLNGDYAEVNTVTGISRLLSRPDQAGDSRVRGLFVPEKKAGERPPAGRAPAQKGG